VDRSNQENVKSILGCNFKKEKSGYLFHLLSFSKGQLSVEDYWLKECKAPAGQTRRG
jgi:hypothetical protein